MVWFRAFNFSGKNKLIALLTSLLLMILYYFCLPEPLFNDPLSTVVEAKDGTLIGARISGDDQWRFPYNSHVPEKFGKAIVTFEDKRFYSHPGFDPLAFARAFAQNIKKREIVSGGSTISMQVIRLARKGKSRTILEKFTELVKATRLELRYKKDEILALYASNAPFGGNTVGLDAASWRYYGKEPELLSWGEATLLAVLPNSPALLHPGRNRGLLLEKRNRLLKKLLNTKIIDSSEFELALDEPIPDKPKPLPNLAPHLIDRILSEQSMRDDASQFRVHTTIDADLQKKVNHIGMRYSQLLKNNDIHNLSALIIDVKTGEIAAYLGNAPLSGSEHGENVDIVKAPRSTGSILKPILYALALQDGKILPSSLIPDIPTNLQGFRPENYLETYDGVVRADAALARSLNVPFVRLLQTYGLEKFHFYLKKLGIKTISKPPKHYGLTLILGGAEGTLWELTNIYACMSRVLGKHYSYNGQYNDRNWHEAYYLKQLNTEQNKPTLEKQTSYIGSDAIWFAFQAMNEVVRPTSEGEWERFQSSRRVAWKTGTSFGNRDAWAIGITPAFAVGIWIGNGDGEGRPGLIGVQTAAPFLFDLFELLPESKWFDPPYDNMRKVRICSQSGFLALESCPVDTVYTPTNALNAQACPYHQILHLDNSGKWRVNAACESPNAMKTESWFVLPPLEEHYYKQRNPSYKSLPPFREDCKTYATRASEATMQLIYPKNAVKIYVPIDLDGNLSRTVFKVAHRSEEAMLYWHLDNEYIGSTKTFHSFELLPSAGKHRLTVVDQNGNILEQEFEVLVKKE